MGSSLNLSCISYGSELILPQDIKWTLTKNGKPLPIPNTVHQEKNYRNSDRIEYNLIFKPLDIVNQGDYTCATYDTGYFSKTIDLNVVAPTTRPAVIMTTTTTMTTSVLQDSTHARAQGNETGVKNNVTHCKSQYFNSATITLLTLIGIILAVITCYLVGDYKQKNDVRNEAYNSVPSHEHTV